MNKRFAFAALTAIAALTLFSCAKPQEIVPEPEITSTLIDPWTSYDISSKVLPVPGPETVVSAGFSQTKSHINMNGGDNYAKVVWDSGDQFRMYGYNSGWKSAVFSTSSSGDKVEFTTPHVTPDATKIHCIYAPQSGGIGLSGDPDFGFGLLIPEEQTAVANGVDQGLLYSYAQTASATEDLSFKSMLALVRFKISGAAASEVTSVTLRGSVPLAKDCILVPSSDGTPEITFSKGFYGDEASTTVTLNGSFAANTWYYFAVAPGTHTSFSLVFSDGTKTCTKVASKTTTFNRGRITSLGEINLGSTLPNDSYSDDPIKFMTASAGAPKAVTLAVVPDGFTEGEMLKYEMLAKSAMNTLFSVEPYKTYKDYFNVYILKVASNESGARIKDGTPEEQQRDCYFQSAWGKDDYTTPETRMEANDNILFQFVEDNCPDILDGSHTIEEIPVLIIINDSRYGGINWTWSSGRAYCMAPYTYEGGGLAWSYSNSGNEAVSDSDPSQGYGPVPAERWAEVGSSTGNWLNTMIHEYAGHCFARLGDEYWTQILPPESFLKEHRYDYLYSGVPFSLNVSVTYNNPGHDDPGAGPEYIKEGWQHLLDLKPTLVASNPLYNRIGVFQGAGTSILNRWRSERISCMMDNRFYFSTFQRELIVRRIMTLAGETFDWDDFLAKDVPEDPVRDIVSSPVLGFKDPVPPRPVPPLPPPVLVVE